MGLWPKLHPISSNSKFTFELNDPSFLMKSSQKKNLKHNQNHHFPISPQLFPEKKRWPIFAPKIFRGPQISIHLHQFSDVETCLFFVEGILGFFGQNLRETQHTPGAYPRHPLSPPNERNSFINCWLGVWGMLQGSVGKVLDKKNALGFLFVPKNFKGLQKCLVGS